MLGIIGAMEEEVSNIKEKLVDLEIIQKAGLDFYKGKLYDKDIVVVRCGIGKVNAALCTQCLIDTFRVDKIINTGIAGGIYKDIEVGDIVISSDAVQYDVDVSIFGYAKGQIPRMDTLAFPTSVELGDIAKKAYHDLYENDFGMYYGRVVSGDTFISDTDSKKALEALDAYCTEMEGASIAHVAYLNNAEVCIIRAISDKADGSANMDYKVFEKEAIEHCTSLTLEMIRQL